MKKVLSIVLAITMVLGLSLAFTACQDNNAGTTKTSFKDGKEDPNKGATTFEIALITDKGNIDDKSFNQGAWEGVEEFAWVNGFTHKYFKPEEASDAGYLAMIEQAIKAGAKVVVTPGFLFEVPIFEAQTKYPDVKFILLDGAPHTADYATFKTEKNVASVMYSEEQSGYLAGYAAVKEGYKKLGFMGGMAVPAVQAFGYGFLQGAEAAGAELGVDVEVKYHYTGNFEENDTNKATAKAMYQGGTEVIFACGGSVGKSVMSAAEEAGKFVIGVDVDQSADSNTVITSATKGLSASVIQVLESIYKTNDFDTKYAGQTYYFNAANKGVGLPQNFSKFTKFAQADYDAVFAKLVDGSAKPVRTIEVEADTGYATSEELTSGLSLTKVKVETVQ